MKPTTRSASNSKTSLPPPPLEQSVINELPLEHQQQVGIKAKTFSRELNRLDIVVVINFPVPSLAFTA